MSEISREEAIEKIKNFILFMKIEDENNEYQFTRSDYNSMEKAISDMEKLQKIESLYGIDKFGKVLTREERDREVQKILRG